MKTTVKEKTPLSREMEQDRRYLTYERDKESLEVWKLDRDNGDEFRVDNLLTNGTYLINFDSGKFTCDCPDFLNRCSKFDLPIRCKHILAVENWKAKKAQPEAIKKHSFDPQKYLIKVKGKDYLEVKYRLHWFRLEHPDWDIKTDVIKLDTDKGIAVVRSDIFDEKNNHKSSGLSMEYQKNFFDYLSKAETSATGRALAALGYGTLQSVELDEGRIVDSPVSLGGNNGRNGNGKIQVQVIKPSGSNGKIKEGSENGKKATPRQVRYIKDLCKELKIEARAFIPSLSKERASELIEGLQKELKERKEP